jgi:alkyl hydroperoxide reductase subunit AhpC
VQVHRRRGEIDEVGGCVLLISFSSPAHGELWRKESGVTFPILFDRQRAVYRAYGLARSGMRSLSLRTLTYYARAIARGEKIRTGRGDPLQLGGDFIVDSGGILRLSHPSHDPVDRPDVRTLLDAMRSAARATGVPQKKSVIQGVGPANSAPSSGAAGLSSESRPARARSDTDA